MHASQGPSHLRVGELLIRRALIEPDDLAVALARQRQRGDDLPIGRILVDMGAISDETLTLVLAEQSGLPVVDLTVVIDPPSLDGDRAEAAVRLHALPIEACADGSFVVAVAEPPTREFRRELDRRLGAHCEFVLATPTALRAALERAFPAEQSSGAAINLIPTSGATYVPPTRTEIDDETGTVDEPSDRPDRILEWLLSLADEFDADALHVTEVDRRVRVRARVDGAMRQVVDLVEDAGAILMRRLARVGDLPDPLTAVHVTTVEGHAFGGAEDLALTATPTAHGRSFVLRPRDGNLNESIDRENRARLRDALTHLVAEVGHGTLLVAAPDTDVRAAVLHLLANEPLLQSRAVAALHLGDGQLPADVCDLDPLDGDGLHAAVLMTRVLDNDVLVVDVGADRVALRAALAVGMDDAVAIVGVAADSVDQAIVIACESTPAVLVASSLATVIGVSDDGGLALLEVTDERREVLRDPRGDLDD